MGIISWIIFGGLAGWVAARITNQESGGLITTILVGLVGAIFGGFIANLVGRTPVFGFNLLSLIVAILGAVVFLALLSAVQRR